MYVIGIPKKLLRLIIIITVAPWLIILVLSIGLFAMMFNLKADAVSHPNEPGLAYQYCSPGPWGEMRYAPLIVEIPDHTISAHLNELASKEWYFPGMSTKNLAELFHSAGLTVGEFPLLNNSSNWRESEHGTFIKPSTDEVQKLSPEMRGQLYKVLAHSLENQAQYYAFALHKAQVEPWFAQSGLSPEAISLVKKFFYSEGDYLLFSDFDAVSASLASPDETTRLIRLMSRATALQFMLKAGPANDIEKLAKYWSKGGTAKDVVPLFQSLQRLPHGYWLDAIHLLTPVSRERMHTWKTPTAWNENLLRIPQLTSTGFFEETLQSESEDPEVFVKTIDEFYYHVSGQPAYGDVVVIINAREQLVHTGIYIADDVVFTKVPGCFPMPWIFMKTEDLKHRLVAQAPLVIKTFRKRNI